MTLTESERNAVGADEPERSRRVDLAAAHRIADYQGFSEGIFNHLTAVTNEHPSAFLGLPFGKHWSEATASGLLLVNFDGEVVAGDGEVERSAYCIHAPIHQARPDAVAVFHTHMPFASALTRLEDPSLLPIGQTEISLLGDVAYDSHYSGFAVDVDEGRRMASVLGDKSIMFLANHGVIVLGRSIAEAYDRLYYLERACQVQVYAMWTGQPLRYVDEEVRSTTAAQFSRVELQNGGRRDAFLHFEALKRVILSKPVADYDS